MLLKKLQVVKLQVMNLKGQDNVLLMFPLFIALFALATLLPPLIFTMEKYGLIMLFVTFMSILLVWLGRKELKPLITPAKPLEVIILLGFSLAVHGLTIWSIKNFAGQPTWPFENRNTSFLLLNNYYIWAKPLDVFIQQLLITLFVMRLKLSGFKLKTIIGCLAICFGAAHVALMLRSDVLIGILYTAVALIFSLIFPIMLLKVKNGFIYNYMLHLGMYSVGALIAWFLY